MFGRANVVGDRGMPTAASARSAQARARGPPPEIGLTQHTLPPTSSPIRGSSLMLDPDSERAAAFRVLRHHLLEVGRPQVVIVSSPQPGEGKTTTALNLALALAECGRAKVLLAETHVRRPQLANVFKLRAAVVLRRAARRAPPPADAAVEPRRDPAALAARRRRSIRASRRRSCSTRPRSRSRWSACALAGYDHIVIDAPPVLGSADVNLMADAADAVVFALRARQSTTRDLRRAIDQIGAAKVVGTVLVE